MIHAEFNIEVANRHGDTIYTTITVPSQSAGAIDSAEDVPLSAEGATYPLVILLHGFKGFRNWGFFPVAAQHLADCGLIVMRMDFSKNGMRGTADRVLSMSDFAENTITLELDDVADLIECLRKSHSPSDVNSALPDDGFQRVRQFWDGTLRFVGHSRGGGIAQLAGAEHAVQKVVVWNSVGRWGRWTPRQREVWMESGTVDVENTRTSQKLQMNRTYVEDIEANSDRLSLINASRVLADRLLFIHAELDLTVQLHEIQALIREADNKPALSIVSNTTHTFGMSHPLDHITPAFAKVLTQTTDFLIA
ncbi:MAG: hypothetical protein SGJ05_09685 [bacterium]|nr:hypothetical protein [bacterium]